MPDTLITIKDLSCSFKGHSEHAIFSSVNATIASGDILVLTGKSGSGKTTLLRCLAHLNPYDGSLLYRGSPPTSYGIPLYRTRVLYVPQRTSLLPGTPRAFLRSLQTFKSRSGKETSDKAFKIASSWGIEDELWDRDWSTLSGGEAQRMALSVAMGLETVEVLLLDEPTSALDAETTSLVEKDIISAVKSDNPLQAVVCVTHSEDQGRRLGTRFLTMDSIATANEYAGSA